MRLSILLSPLLSPISASASECDAGCHFRARKKPLTGSCPSRSRLVRWLCVSYLMLEHLRSTDTLLPCSAAKRRQAQNTSELVRVVVQHVILLVLQGPRCGPSTGQCGSCYRTILRHHMGPTSIRQPPFQNHPSSRVRLNTSGFVCVKGKIGARARKRQGAVRPGVALLSDDTRPPSPTPSAQTVHDRTGKIVPSTHRRLMVVIDVNICPCETAGHRHILKHHRPFGCQPACKKETRHGPS